MRSTGKRILILGAQSAIAEAVARREAKAGTCMLLVGRKAAALAQIASDLSLRGACCLTETCDLAAPGNAASLLKGWTARLGDVDAIYLFYGILGDHTAAERDNSELRNILRVNFTSAAEWCLAAAEVLEGLNHGVLVAISSVAGDRGRQSNYIYGAAKGGLSILVQGLAHRFASRRSRARAVVVKLGLIDTPMTAHMEGKGGFLWSTPDKAAAGIVKAARDHAPVRYVPWFWRWILLAVRLIPAPIFHKTKL